MLNNKETGYVLVEALVTLFAFSILFISFIYIYQEVLENKNNRQLHFNAILIARSELNKASLDNDILQQTSYIHRNIPPYNVEISSKPYSEKMMELKVAVTWSVGKLQSKEMMLKKLVVTY